METEKLSIGEFMRQLVPSGQLPKHTRELVRVLEDFGVEVKLPSRACACLAAHTERETFLLDAELPLTATEVCRRQDEFYNGIREAALDPGAMAFELRDVLLRLLKEKEGETIFKPRIDRYCGEKVSGPGLAAAIGRVEIDEHSFNCAVERMMNPMMTVAADGTVSRADGVVLGQPVDNLQLRGLQAEFDVLLEDEYACNEGLAFLAVEVADDGGFVVNTEKRSL